MNLRLHCSFQISLKITVEDFDLLPTGCSKYQDKVSRFIGAQDY